MKIDAILLSQELIRCKSITPIDDGAIDLLSNYLEKLGFKVTKLEFSDDIETVNNLFAIYENGGKNLAFAGHTDVVPPGDISNWMHNPFDGEIHNNILYGRGASDMKCAIACFIAAVAKYIEENKNNKNFTFSFIITGDEEARAKLGTIKILEWISKNNIKLDSCLVGEPTSVNKLGDMIKIGRRGTVNFTLEIIGVQGHVAYPHLAKNPITTLVKILNDIKNHKLDESNNEFQASNLEITNLEVNNQTSNVIPGKAKAYFNIRFNNIHSSQSLFQIIDKYCKNYLETNEYKLEITSSSESFLTDNLDLQKILIESVKLEMGYDPEVSTTGGTSDARFIKDFCPVIELGMSNKTAHKIDENVSVADIKSLTNIYYKFIEKYFS